MKVTVDYSLCQSNALCMAVAPGVFDVDAQGDLHVLDDDPPAERHDEVREAARVCPTQAVFLDA